MANPSGAATAVDPTRPRAGSGAATAVVPTRPRARSAADSPAPRPKKRPARDSLNHSHTPRILSQNAYITAPSATTAPIARPTGFAYMAMLSNHCFAAKKAVARPVFLATPPATVVTFAQAAVAHVAAHVAAVVFFSAAQMRRMPATLPLMPAIDHIHAFTAMLSPTMPAVRPTTPAVRSGYASTSDATHTIIGPSAPTVAFSIGRRVDPTAPAS